MTLSTQRFEAWIEAYGKAWIARDSNRFGALFAEDAIYYWTPFNEPLKGREAIVAAFSKAVGGERDIEYGARVLYTSAELGAAHWSAALTKLRGGKRQHLDGIFVVVFNEAGKAISLRQWHHQDER